MDNKYNIDLNYWEIGETNFSDYYRNTNNDVIKRCSINEQKEKYPILTLIKFSFSEESRVAKIEFNQSQQYRTIDRYVTKDYVKYPIYSYWKTKNKQISKTIKLTNAELENLINNKDPLIAIFAPDIVKALHNNELEPSWYLKKIYLKEYEKIAKDLAQECDNYTLPLDKKIGANKIQIHNYQKLINSINDDIVKNEAKLSKLDLKINKIESIPKSILKSIFSLGIYSFLRSKHRINKLNIKKSKINKLIIDGKKGIEIDEQQISYLNEQISEYETQINNKKTDTEKSRSKAYNDLSKKIKNVKPLPISVVELSSFTPLKSFTGLGTEKVMGCYIIHNKSNDKYYVGQSKNIATRLRQHFDGTKPKNIIFAEDYYSTPEDQRDDLFEINIIACTLKDELDAIEKENIAKYDAFRSGYNGTKGNS